MNNQIAVLCCSVAVFVIACGEPATPPNPARLKFAQDAINAARDAKIIMKEGQSIIYVDQNWYRLSLEEKRGLIASYGAVKNEIAIEFRDGYSGKPVATVSGGGRITIE